MTNPDAAPVLRSLHCPACGALPGLILGPTVAFCANDDCNALQYDPAADPAAQLGNPTLIDSPWPVIEGHRALPVVPAAPDRTQPDVESRMRIMFHTRWGLMCADGTADCAWCGTTLHVPESADGANRGVPGSLGGGGGPHPGP